MSPQPHIAICVRLISRHYGEEVGVERARDEIRHLAHISPGGTRSEEQLCQELQMATVLSIGELAAAAEHWV